MTSKTTQAIANTNEPAYGTILSNNILKMVTQYHFLHYFLHY